MRALVATVLSLALLVGVVHPHVHVDGHGSEGCAVCVLRHTDAPPSDTPDVAPRVHVVADVVCAPGLPPVSGAPLGAIPGQSPPAAT
jgi:hypothetical protein